MKKVYITLLMAIMAVSAVAQNRSVQDRGFMGANPAKLAPLLMAKQQFTVEQQEAIHALKLELKKEFLQLNNQLAEKKTQLKSLQQVEKPNLKAINSKIDEITDLQNKKMKMTAQNQIKIRELLTAEQRLAYDLRMNSSRKAHKMGSMNNRAGMHQRGAMSNRAGMNQRGNMNQRGAMPNRAGMGNQNKVD